MSDLQKCLGCQLPKQAFPPRRFHPPEVLWAAGACGGRGFGALVMLLHPPAPSALWAQNKFRKKFAGVDPGQDPKPTRGGGQQKRSLSPTPARGGGRACVGVASTVLSRTSGGQLANNQSMVFDVALPNMGVMARLFSTGQPDGETLAADAWTSSGSQTRSGRRTGQGAHPSAQPHPALGTPLLSQNGDRNSLRK